MQQVEENVTNAGTSGVGVLTEEGLPSRALRLCRRGHRSARGQGDNELLPYAEPSTRQAIGPMIALTVVSYLAAMSYNVSPALTL